MSTSRNISAALVGCPNVGKSSVFNSLTGLKQRTGNWTGVTVSLAVGEFAFGDTAVHLTDLPGIYSTKAHSPEEDVTVRCLSTNSDDCVICVCDATSIERSLRLALEVRDISRNVIIALNLVDEAKRQGIVIDTAQLSELAGLRVVETSAKLGVGMDELKSAIVECGNTAAEYADKATLACASPSCGCKTCAGCAGCNKATDYRGLAREITKKCVISRENLATRGSKIDRFICGKYTSVISTAILLSGVLWLTLTGSGYISSALDYVLSLIYGVILRVSDSVFSAWLSSLITEGVIGTVFRVVGVMLPPMAIFFPLFSLLEDLGFLPRVAFNLDRCFACCGSCGKQSLTMMMGLGCNAAGVVGCRIIDSPKERAIAIVTNSLVPCNGRFPLIIAALGALGMGSALSASALTLLCIFAFAVTLGTSKLLSATVYRGEKSSFTLELPPWRVPNVGHVIVRSALDKTLSVLGRAVTVAAPAGTVIWIMGEVHVGGESLYSHAAALLQPIGALAGMDGGIMLAFILALPAAELMLPLALFGAAGSLSAAADLSSAFSAVGWETKTVICMILFMMFHFPCATTLATVYRETKSVRTTVLSAVLPTVIGYAMCACVNLFFTLFY